MGCAADRSGAGEGARNPKRLILAAADYAENKTTTPPRELEIHASLMQFNALYLSGGWADQPYALMRRIQAAHNVYSAMSKFRASKSWAELQAHEPETWRIIEQVILLRQTENQYG